MEKFRAPTRPNDHLRHAPFALRTCMHDEFVRRKYTRLKHANDAGQGGRLDFMQQSTSADSVLRQEVLRVCRQRRR